MKQIHELRDSQRKAYEILLDERLKDLIQSKSCNIGKDYNLSCRMFPVDREVPVTEDGTDYYPIRVECLLESKVNEGKVSFCVDLLKVPVFYELGFKIGGNYMQMLDSYERTQGWSFSVMNENAEKFPTITAKALAGYGRNFAFVYDNRRRAIVDLNGLSKGKRTSKKEVSAAVFMGALNRMSKFELIDLFGEDNSFVLEIFNNLKGDLNQWVETLCEAMFGAARTKSLSTLKMKIREIERQIFSRNYFNLGADNRKRFTNIQSFQNRAKGKLLAEKLEVNGTVYDPGTLLTTELLEMIDALPIDTLKIFHNEKVYKLKKFSKLTFRAFGAKLLDDVPELGLVKGKNLNLEDLRKLNDSSISKIRVAFNEKEEVIQTRRVSAQNLTSDDINTVFSMWLDNLNGLGIYDKQYELTNRMCISFDDLICNSIDRAMHTIISSLEEKTKIISTDDLLASVVLDFGKQINTNEFIEAVKDAKDGNGQMAEMCNIVSFVSKSNKISTSIDPDNITPEMVAVQDTQEGRLDPFDVPESNKIGSVHHKTVLAECDESGSLTSPYLKVESGRVVSEEPVYLSAIDEAGKYIAAWDETFTEADGTKKKNVSVRCDGNVLTVKTDKVTYKEYSNLQTMSVTHGMVTFPGHSNAKRITMSCNQQKQAMVTVNTERPFVGTGCESIFDFGTYNGASILKKYYSGYSEIMPGLKEYQDRIQRSNIKLLHFTSGKQTRTFEFEVIAVKEINDEYNTNFDTTISIDVPYMLRNFNESVFSYRINHMKDKTYKPDDVVLYSMGYSLERKERVDLVDFGAYPVDEKCFDKGLAMGQNLVVGYKTCSSATIDDAVLISDKLIYSDKMTHLRLILKEDELHNSDDVSERFGRRESGDKKFDHRGLPKAGVYLRPGDKCISKIVTRNNNRINVKYKRLSPYEEGQVIKAEIIIKNGKTIAQVLLAGRSPIEQGDKVAGRHGNKGVVAQILPEEEMPFDPKTGLPLDICLNPLGVPSRQNISQLIEVTLGMCRLIDGKNSYVSPYHKGDLDFVKEQAEKFDAKPKILIDGRTGEKFKRPINVGVIYISKLQQTAVSGIHAIGMNAPVDPVFLQPRKGAKNDGGQSFGEMENWCLHGLGANKLLRDLYGFQSDDVSAREEAISQFSGGSIELFSVESQNQNDTVVQAMLRSLGVTVVSENSEYSLRPMTDEMVMALNARPVSNEFELHSGAIFGNDSTPMLKQYAKENWSWMDLGTEIIHPMWLTKNPFGCYINIRFDEENTTLSSNVIHAILREGAHIIEKFGVWHVYTNGHLEKFKPLLPEELGSCLHGMEGLVNIFKTTDLNDVVSQLSGACEKKAENGKVSSKEYVKLAKRLAVVRAFVEAGDSLSNYVISKFPVMPTSFRPVIQMEQRGSSDSDFDYYYKQIISAVRNVKTNSSPTAVIELYDCICNFTGVGDVDPMTAKKYRNILNYFAGVGSSSDHGKIRSSSQSKRIFCSGRATITPAEYRISPMQLGVPAAMLVVMGAEPLAAYFNSKRTTEIQKIGTKKLEHLFVALATENYAKFSKMYRYDTAFSDQYDFKVHTAYDTMKQWIVDFFEGKNGCSPQIVVAGRQPSLHRYSIRAFYVVVLWTKTIQINSLVCKGYNADFDGDKMWVSLCMTEDARQDALGKMTPKSDMLNPKDSSVILEHTQDIALGCYVATMLKDNAEVYSQTIEDTLFYDSVAALETDIFAGIIEPYDLVCFNLTYDDESKTYLSTAGRVLFNALVEGFTDREFSNPLGIQGVDCSRFYDLAYDGLITCGKGGNGTIKYLNLKDICKELYLNENSRCIDMYYDIELFGFKFSDMFGVSIGITDMDIKSNKEELLAEAAAKKVQIEQDYLDGLIAEEDKREAVIAIYTSDEFGVNPKIEKDLMENLDRNNNLFIMMDSGARGNKTQIMHMCGAIGVLEKTKTETMETSITSNYYEGLNDFDVHLTSYSARTGVASTQRETRNAGYATRKVIYMTDGTKIVANDCKKQDWWYDAIWDDRIDSAGLFYPSKGWFELNLLGRTVDRQEITENDFEVFSKDGFNSICFDDGKEPSEFKADPYILIGSKLVDEVGKKYFRRLTDQDGKFNSVCADSFDKYKLKSLATTFGKLTCRYKLYGSCRSQLMYREARDLKFLKSFRNKATNEDVKVITEETLNWIEQEGIDRIAARVMLDCECKNGVCAHCYGLKYSNLQLPEVNEIVGTESAQAIGEPSAQLTMNVINKGGVAGASIASGIDVFNAYLNGSVAGGNKSTLADIPERSGYVHVVKMDDTVSVCVEPVNKKCSMCESCMTKNNLNSCPIQLHLKDCDMKCMIPHKIQQSSLLVRDGEWIESGYPITSYPLVSDSIKTVKDSDDMRQVLRHKQMIWINNYYNIFRDQSISINVRHFELLAMIQNQYVTVVSSGDPKYKIGEERD